MTAERPAPASARIFSAVRSQLREVADDALEGVLDQLEARVLQRRAAGARAGRGNQLERMREVLERDRALASATLPEAAPAQSPIAASPLTGSTTATAATACEEPIRTRTMAKLLVAQGHPERALAIYAYLLAQDAGDPSLQAELAALRAAQSRTA